MKLKEEDFTKLTENTKPEPMALVWCKRKSGEIVLAFRKDAVFAPKDSSPQNYCNWSGFKTEFGLYLCEGYSLERNISFSDVTVESWCYLAKPDVKGDL